MPDYPKSILRPVELTPDFWVADQIFPAQMAKLQEDGFTRILSARPDNEEDEDEQPPRFLLEKTAMDREIQFSHLPVESGAAFTESAIRGAAHMFLGPRHKTLAYCLTGIRSARLWALGNALAGTIRPAQIIKTAHKAGFDLSQFSNHLERLAAGKAPFYVADDYANLI